MHVIVDIETNKLEDPDICWVVVCREVESGKVHVFERPDLSRQPLAAFAGGVSCWIGHNLVGFDRPQLARLCNLNIQPNQLLDTLVLSKLLNANRDGGHSLDSWGKTLGIYKGSFSSFGSFSKEMVDYCIQDTLVTLELYKKFIPYVSSERWADAIRIEHQMAMVCQDMREGGFAFDIEAAKSLHSQIVSEVRVLTDELQTAFPPRSKLIREITPRETQHGTLHRGDFRWADNGDLTPYSVGATFSLFEWEPFNPGSPKQVVERLNAAGWRPSEKTKGHIQAERDRDQERLEYFRTYGWKVSEANLATLPKEAPEAAQKLVRWLLLDSRRSTLEEWIKAYKPATGRIHGSFNHIGAWTHRMSHSAPNMANIPSGDTPYAHEMRSMWKVPDGRLLVGVDADGIQLRILAHYMDDPAFTEALVNGKKEDGTDAHSLNRNALGLNHVTRDNAKTFIYAWLLGAGTAKVAQILNCNTKLAKSATNRFVGFYPGLKELKASKIPSDAARGYFEGLDKRLVICDNEHLMLAGYLQNGETVVMKHANILWREKLKHLGIDFQQVNFVHDEWQTEVPGNQELAMIVAQTQADSIREIGEYLNLRCPLAGSILNANKKPAIGPDWSYTH